MTLAVILMFSMVCTSSAVRSSGQSAVQSASATETAGKENPPAQDQATPPRAQTPPAASPTAPAPKSSSRSQTKTTPRHHHKKRVLPLNCNPTPTPAPTGTDQAGSTSVPSDPPATASAPTPCPPPKVVVQQGGASEPSVQLAGGPPGGQASHARDTAKQMLGSTEANLKKIAGRQLTPNQQDMVNQIHQFMDQSKTAVDAGDLERARTLAWKAQLLSEELVKPEK